MFKLSPLKSKDIFFRYKITIIFTCSIFLFLLGFLFYFQVIKGNFFYQISEKNRIRLIRIKAARGKIFDRNKKSLTAITPSFMATFYPWDMSEKTKTEVINKLEKILNISDEQIKKEIKKTQKYTFVNLKKDVSLKEITFIEEHKTEFPQVQIVSIPKRKYNYPYECSHILGYLGEITKDELKSKKWLKYNPGDYIGKMGIERIYNNYLKGEDGGYLITVDVSGKQINDQKISYLPKPGNNIILNIDLALQKKAFDCLRNYIGAIVVLDTNNGEVLTLASSPAFNSNFLDLQTLTNKRYPLMNRCIQGQYLPGSIFKLITAIAFIEKGLNTTHFISCNGVYQKGKYQYRCWKREGHNSLDLVSALACSCNVFFYQAGEIVGVTLLHKYAETFGLGQITEIDLTNEKRGVVPNPYWKKKVLKRSWFTGDTIHLSIGQGNVLVTPIQMANLIATIANGGTLYKPSIVNKIIDINGNIIFNSKKVIKRKIFIDEKALSLVRQGLWETVNTEKGTGKNTKLDWIEIVGKTGTAQISKMGEIVIDINQLPFNKRPHSWFIGYAPFKNPKIAMAVIIENGGYGGEIATTIAKEIFMTYFNVNSKLYLKK